MKAQSPKKKGKKKRNNNNNKGKEEDLGQVKGNAARISVRGYVARRALRP